MSALAILLLAAAPAAQPPPPPEEEIVVVARRIRTWRGKLKARRGTLTCQTTKSTGDREIDAVACHALMTCLAPIDAEMSAITRARLPREEKRRQVNARFRAQIPCMDETRNRGLEALIARRRGQ